ncbi:uncharacterized protein At4g15970-like [Sesamum indicum]|uniref:Uncharacterized protein At4g15970-like n=1 Tax=Sesamum indicum TaxID=4182 RepID=A0A8M8UU56_SESIN|nr:uncharacterized protein At4g15970-like [Sesamum indicum]
MYLDGGSKLGGQLLEEFGGGYYHLNPKHNQYSLCNNLLKAVLLFAMITLTGLVLFRAPESPFQLSRSIYSSLAFSSSPVYNSRSCAADSVSKISEELWLKQVLERSAMPNKTVIITTLNEAWIEQDSIFDLFLESFTIGKETYPLLRHLVVIALDPKAFYRCSALQLNCYFLGTEGINFSNEAHFMTPDYLKMMWRRIDFLRNVLELGYNFVFTDADIMWFRNPFLHFYTDDTDFQIACDHFGGNPDDLNNAPNGGFKYVKSNSRTIEFYKLWYKSREVFPGKHDQDVLNNIKHNPYLKRIGLKIKFLDTAFFGGFCQPSKDLNLVTTMHANCCAGLDNKINDLTILLDDWQEYLALPDHIREDKPPSWSVPQKCGPASFGSHTPRRKNIGGKR